MKFPSPCWEGLSRLLSAVLTGEGSARWSASLPGVPRRGGNFMSGSQGARGQRGLRRLIRSAGCCIGLARYGLFISAPSSSARSQTSPARGAQPWPGGQSRLLPLPPLPPPVSPRAACVPGGIAGTHETPDAHAPARRAAGVNASLLRWSR